MLMVMDHQLAIRLAGFLSKKQPLGTCLSICHSLDVHLIWVNSVAITSVTCYLSASCLMAHKASTERRHFTRSAADVLASAHDVHPASSLSFSTVRLQVVFGLPLLLFPSGAQVIAVLQSLFWSCLSI